MTEAELITCRPTRGEEGRALRAFCPFHGSDHQRSLRVDLETGHINCYACGAWGYLAESRERWQEEYRGQRRSTGPHVGRKDSVTSYAPLTGSSMPRGGWSDPAPVRDDLARLLRAYQDALPGSLGEEYLRRRGISPETALQSRAGYAAPGRWAHNARDWKWGRVVFPETTPDGDVVNLYGRAVGPDEKVPKPQRHDHLPGNKGYFNAVALLSSKGPVFVCEGAIDAMSLIAAGHTRTVAIFGVDGWRWRWARDIRQLVFALDADAAGQQAWRVLAREARLRGKEVAYLPGRAYGGHKDANQAWVAGTLMVGIWPGAPVVHEATHDGSMHEKTAAVPRWWRELARWPEDRREAWAERAAILEVEGGVVRHEAELTAFLMTSRATGSV